MCSSVDLPAPDGATSATDCPGHTASSRVLENIKPLVSLAEMTANAVQEEKRLFLVVR